MKQFLAAVALATLAWSSAQAGDISGAGATFPYPIYAKWADAYKQKTGIGLNYQSIGSGGGIKQIKAKTVTFGASDMFLGQLIEYGPTEAIFTNPKNEQTQGYITGRFG